MRHRLLLTSSLCSRRIVRVDKIRRKCAAAISPNAALSCSRFVISFELTIQVDRIQRDRNPAHLLGADLAL